jgi:hypothetical protein
MTEHVVFHVHNDYATQQAEPFRIRKRVPDQQPPGTTAKRPEGLFLQLSIQTVARGY